MICPKCKTENNPGVTVCENCGFEMISNPGEFKLLIPDEKISTSLDKKAEELTKEPEPTKKEIKKQKKQEKQEKKKSPAKKKSSKKQKKALIAFYVVLGVCALLMLSLLVVSFETDVFDKKDSNSLTFSTMSADEKSALLTEIKTVTPLFSSGFDSKTQSFDSVLDLIRPNDENGLFAKVSGKTKSNDEEKDPRERFSKSTRLKLDSVSAIASKLGAKAYTDVDFENCYCQNDVFFFNTLDQKLPEVSDVEISDTKKTTDGDYYVSVTANVSGSEKEIYLLVTIKKTDSKTSYVFKTISLTPLYNKYLEKITPEKGEVSFQMKRRVISIKASNGVEFKKFSLEYPKFLSDGESEKMLNEMFDAIISSDLSLKSTVDTEYKAFIKHGGKKSDLPLKSTIVATVEFKNNDILSVLQRTTADSFERQEDKTYKMVKKTIFEGYTYNRENGEFLKKDALLGKDFTKIQDDLTKAFEKQTGLSAGENSTIGADIYSSSFIATDKNVIFCYQGENGMQRISIPIDKSQKE